MLLAETKRYTDANFTDKLTTKNRFTKNYILKNDIPNQNIENTHPREEMLLLYIHLIYLLYIIVYDICILYVYMYISLRMVCRNFSRVLYWNSNITTMV